MCPGQTEREMVRAEGVEPSWACARWIFLPATAFAALAARALYCAPRPVWGLDYPFTILQMMLSAT
jgi:hypothetical protein